MVLFRLWIQGVPAGVRPQWLMQGRPLLLNGKIADGGSVGCTSCVRPPFQLITLDSSEPGTQIRSQGPSTASVVAAGSDAETSSQETAPQRSFFVSAYRRDMNDSAHFSRDFRALPMGYN
jgi:hypothetical protein